MRVAEIFDMSLLYKKELPMLKLFFYQLDRLIAIQLPQLHQHFKDEQMSDYKTLSWLHKEKPWWNENLLAYQQSHYIEVAQGKE